MIEIAIDAPFAYVSDGSGTTAAIRVLSDSKEAIMDSSFCVVLSDGTTRYRFLRISDMAIGYGINAQYGNGISDVMRLVGGGLAMPDGMSVATIMEKGPLSESFASAYMPDKRQGITYGQRVIAYRRYGGRCAYCGREISFDEMQVDHFVSHYRNGGRDETGNYMPSCADCNGLKSDYDIEEFRELIRRCAGARKGTRGYRIAMRYGVLSNPRKRIVFHFEKKGL